MSEVIGWAIVGLMLYGYEALVCAVFGAFTLQLASRIVAKFWPAYIRALLIALLGYAIILVMWFLIFVTCATSGITPGEILIITLLPGVFSQAALCMWLLKSKDQQNRVSYGTGCLISIIHLLASVVIYRLLHPLVGIILDELGVI